MFLMRKEVCEKYLIFTLEIINAMICVAAFLVRAYA